MSEIVLGLGLSSHATLDELRGLAEKVLRSVDLGLESISVVATRICFADDPRLSLGARVVCVDDSILLSQFPTLANSQRPGIAARVAEGCALVAAGHNAELWVATIASAHATAALARGSREGGK